MTTQNYAIISSSGMVENMIVWDGIAAFEPPVGTSAVAVPAGETVCIGYSYSAGAFIAPSVAGTAQTLAQQATALINGGITITSTGTPALNGTYSTDAAAQQNAANIMGYITQNQKFPGSNPSGLAWLTAAGEPVVFPTIAEFTAFYNAGMDFVLDCQMIVLTGAGTLPPTAYTIP